MLDPDIPDERREQIAAEARARIESGGSLKQDTAWGMRKLAYEIEQRTEADYRYFRFDTDGGLLDDLNHNLRIADGVLRFRIFKVDPRSPAIAPPAAMSAATPARSARRPQTAPDREEAAEPAAPPAPAPESAQEDEAPTEEPPEESDRPAPEQGSEANEESQ